MTDLVKFLFSTNPCCKQKIVMSEAKLHPHVLCGLARWWQVEWLTHKKRTKLQQLNPSGYSGSLILQTFVFVLQPFQYIA